MEEHPTSSLWYSAHSSVVVHSIWLTVVQDMELPIIGETRFPYTTISDGPFELEGSRVRDRRLGSGDEEAGP